MSKVINKFGTLIGWNNVKVNMLGRDLEGIVSVEYDDEVESNNEYGAGKFPVGQSVGNYTPSASLEIYVEELQALQKSLPKGGRVQDIPPFDIVVNYENEGEFYKDIIRGFRIKKFPKSPKQGEGKMTSKIEGTPSHIDWNV